VTKPNENLQLIREMQDMAVSLKAKARGQSVDRDVKIMKIAEDILTVLKVYIYSSIFVLFVSVYLFIYLITYFVGTVPGRYSGDS
jgi:hypothetical protein